MGEEKVVKINEIVFGSDGTAYINKATADELILDSGVLLKPGCL